MSLTITISGVYLDPEAQPLPGISLVFKTAYNTTQTQLQTEVKTVTADDASYSISLVPNVYSVSEVSNGRKKWLGNIQIFADSSPGSLNEYLTAFQVDQMRPGILAEMEEILEETKAAAANAGVTPRGAYAADTAYSVNDLVEYEGSEYRATSDTTGVEPPAAPWELFVSVGDTGPANSLAIGTVTTLPPGEQATATITGDAPEQVLNLNLPQGEKGDPGDSATIPENWNSPGSTVMVYSAKNTDTTTKKAGTEVAGSALTDGGIQYDIATASFLTLNGGQALPGTWRLQGVIGAGETGQSVSLAIRIDSVSEQQLQASNITSMVRNLAYVTEDGSLIDCELFYRNAWHPFTASLDDPTWWGKAIYEAAVASELGEVAPYTESK
jgi:hypothetical protein